MRRKRKQIWAFLLTLTMAVMVVACGENVPDALQEPAASSDVSDEQKMPPDDGDADIEPVVERSDPVSLYKTISKYSGDVLQETIECTYNDRDLMLSCEVVESGEKYIFSYDMSGRITDAKVFDGNETLIDWESLDEEGDKIVDLEYNYDGSIYIGYQYQCDESGKKIKCINHSTDGSYYEETYDKKGNVANRIYYNSDGSEERSMFHEYEYDADGNIMAENVTSSYGVAYQVKYEYDADGSKIKETIYDADGTVSRWYEYEYDDNGNKVRYSSYEKYNGEDFPGLAHTHTWEYDSDGNMLKHVEYRQDGSISVEEEYDPKGQLIKELHYDDDGTFLSGSKNEYDADGRITQSTFYSDGVIWIKQMYKYGSNGKAELVTTRNGVEKSELSRTEFEYDSEGNLLRSSAYDSQGNAVIVEYQTVFFAVDEEKTQSGYLPMYSDLLSLERQANSYHASDFIFSKNALKSVWNNRERAASSDILIL